MTLEEAYVSIYEDKRLKGLRSFYYSEEQQILNVISKLDLKKYDNDDITFAIYYPYKNHFYTDNIHAGKDSVYKIAKIISEYAYPHDYYIEIVLADHESDSFFKIFRIFYNKNEKKWDTKKYEPRTFW